ncbi:unnamed protein product, partial [Amoebophrya sp. A120]
TSSGGKREVNTDLVATRKRRRISLQGIRPPRVEAKMPLKKTSTEQVASSSSAASSAAVKTEQSTSIFSTTHNVKTKLSSSVSVEVENLEGGANQTAKKQGKVRTGSEQADDDESLSQAKV